MSSTLRQTDTHTQTCTDTHAQVSISNHRTILLTDQLFASVAALLLQKADFQTPSEVLDYLYTRMRTRLERRGKFFTRALSAVRDYCRWLHPIHLTLYNGFACRGGIETAHSFSYKPQALLSAQECDQFPGGPDLRQSHGNTMDVYCVVKAYVRDIALNQAPLLVLRPADAQRVQGRVPCNIVPLRPLSTERVETLLSLAGALELPGQELPRAVAAIKDLVHSTAYALMDLPWLEQPRQVHVPEGEAVGASPVFPHLPRLTWPLLIRHGAKLPRRAEAVQVPSL